MFQHWRVTCTGGFAHGVLIQHVAEIGWEPVEADLPGFCDDMTSKIAAVHADKMQSPAWLQWSCYHMIGHVIYEHYRDNIAEGADLCLEFGDDALQLR